MTFLFVSFQYKCAKQILNGQMDRWCQVKDTTAGFKQIAQVPAATIATKHPWDTLVGTGQSNQGSKADIREKLRTGAFSLSYGRFHLPATCSDVRATGDQIDRCVRR